MLKLMNRIQVGLALMSSIGTLAICVAAAITASPVLSAICPIFGVASLIAWQMCD